MNFNVDKNFNPMVLGPKGDYITIDEFENLLNVANFTDGDKVTELLEKFPTEPSVKVRNDGTKPPIENFNAERTVYLGQITRLLKSGDGDISGDNITTAFMFDSEVTLPDGETQNFVKWYLNKPDLFPKGFDDLYSEYKKEYMLGGENEEKMLNIIAQDLIKNDPNVKEDLMEYIKSILDLSK